MRAILKRIEFVTGKRTFAYQSKAIICPRASDLFLPSQSTAESAIFDSNRCPGCRGSPDLWVRFCDLPGSRNDQSQRLWHGDSESLLRCASEEWKDGVHLRSAAGADLR